MAPGIYPSSKLKPTSKPKPPLRLSELSTPPGLPAGQRCRHRARYQQRPARGVSHRPQDQVRRIDPDVGRRGVRTGDRRKDVAIDRLINAIAKTQETVYVPLTLEIAEHGGLLRTRALASEDRDISIIDGYIVSTACDLAHQSAVTILTGDPNDMTILVDLTRRSNIAVKVMG
jgi:hypothetical protein